MKKKIHTGKESFVIPSANLYTNEENYMSDCMKVATREFPQKQALAICLANWRNRTRI